MGGVGCTDYIGLKLGKKTTVCFVLYTDYIGLKLGLAGGVERPMLFWGWTEGVLVLSWGFQ